MPDALEDLIALYPDLGPDDRAAVDARVRAEHPDGLPAHADAQRLAALVDRARQPESALDRTLDAAFGEAGPDGLAPDDRAALGALFPADARAHFRALDAHVRARHPDPFVRPEAPAAATRAAGRTPSPAADRPASSRARAQRPAWARPYAWATALVLLVGSVAVWRGMDAPLGDFTAQELSVEGYGTVRAGGDAATPDEAYLLALQELAAARTTTLGLYPRYDRARLVRAQATLARIAEDEDAGDFLRLEALYALGKVHLLLGNRAAAADVLRGVVAQGGGRTDDADALLRAMDGPAAR